MSTKMHEWLDNNSICSPIIVKQIKDIVDEYELEGYYDRINRVEYLVFGVMGRDPNLAIELLKEMLNEFSNNESNKTKRNVKWLFDGDDLKEDFEEKTEGKIGDEDDDIERINKKTKHDHIEANRYETKRKPDEYYFNRAVHFLSKIVSSETKNPCATAFAIAASIIQHLKENDDVDPQQTLLNWFKSEVPLSRWLQTFDNI